MEPGPSSQEALQSLLSERSCNLRSRHLANFRDWLAPLLAQWQQSLVFQARVKIRDIRHSSPLLRQLEHDLRQTERQDQESESFTEISQVEKDLSNTAKALKGLHGAWQQATEPERQQALKDKLEGFRQQQLHLETRLRHLVEASPTRQRVIQLREQLDQLKESLGLVDKEKQLAALLRRQGQSSGQAGQDFEARALQATQHFILPGIQPMDSPVERIQVLTGVTLGAARMELDQLIVQTATRKDEAVLVLALVETKRNINDLAQGFRQRQENLAWLTGTPTGYDPELYRNRNFPNGHFDQEVCWAQDGREYLFRPESFRLFHPETSGYFLERLYFITRPGPLWGLSSAALSRLQYRIATDERCQLDDDGYLQSLLEWCQSLAEPLETPDLLRLYCETPAKAKHIILLP